MSFGYIYDLEQGGFIPSWEYKPYWATIIFVFTTVGMSLSAIALLLLILTAVLFVEWRKSYKNQLLIQLMIARFLYTFVRYMYDIQKIFDVSPAIDLVTMDILLLITTEMALVTWMFVFSRQMYLNFVKVFDTENASIWKVSICAWAVGAVISFLFYLLYHVRDRNSLHYMICIVIFKWPVLISNAVLLIMVLRSILNNSMNTKSNVKVIVVMLIMIFAFCFQQMFIDIYKIVTIGTDYVYFGVVATTVLTSNIITIYHCAFSILFWLFGNENTRKLWKFQKKEISDKIKLNVRFSA